jgi:hypothetical protein
MIVGHFRYRVNGEDLFGAFFVHDEHNYRVIKFIKLPINNESELVVEYPQLMDLYFLEFDKTNISYVSKTILKYPILVANAALFISNHLIFRRAMSDVYTISTKIEVNVTNGIFERISIGQDEFIKDVNCLSIVERFDNFQFRFVLLYIKIFNFVVVV